MKYSFNTWAYSSFPCWVPAYPLKDTIERLSRIGYDALELGCAQPHAWPDFLNTEKRKEICKWLTDNNIVISSMLPCPGGGPGANAASAISEERSWTIQHLKDVIDLGLDLGCNKLLYVGGWAVFGTSHSDAWKYSLDTLQNVGEYALKHGVEIMVEPTAFDSNVIESADDALLIREQAELPNIYVMFDTAHAFYRNEVPSDYVYTMGKNLKHIHITDHNRMPPGTAGGDFLSIMQALKDINYDGYVTMETGFAKRSDDPDVAARLSLEYLKTLEDKLV